MNFENQKKPRNLANHFKAEILKNAELIILTTTTTTTEKNRSKATETDINVITRRWLQDWNIIKLSL